MEQNNFFSSTTKRYTTIKNLNPNFKVPTFLNMLFTINNDLFPTVPPVITIRNQLVGAALGTDLVLECETEAYPKPVTYWSRDNGEIVPVGEITRFIII